MHDRNWCSNTFSKRHRCIITKASELSEFTYAPVAVIMFSPGGKLKAFESPSMEQVFSTYLCHKYGVKPPMSAEAERESESCLTKEGCASWIINFLDAVVRLLKKFVEDDPSFLQPVRSLSRRNMQTGSSLDQKSCSNMFSRRSNCILKKAFEISKDTGTPVAVIMFSPAGNLKSFGWPSIEEVFLKYLCHKYGMKPPMSAEVERECESKEHCASLIMKYLEAVIPLLRKLKDFEVHEIVPLIDDFRAIAPEPHYNIFVRPNHVVDRSDSAADDESSGVDSDSTDFNPDDYIRTPDDYIRTSLPGEVDSNSMDFNPDDYIRTLSPVSCASPEED
ncbi:hypothetical protein ACJRO7_009813 [Eucalyptus globulus]|uniref:MADS-box domain-containing protein n=1 Tax=Eucalyptus globulus TaxID=34317 RepID=A0ABD3LA04_EUCGL